MGKASPAITSFAAGELSPDMEARIDVDKYQVGAHVMENFQCLVQGPALKRAGTVYVAITKSSPAYLRRFIFSASQSFQIEFGVGYCRFYQPGVGPVRVSGVAAYNNGTTYNKGDLVVSAGVNYYCIATTVGHAPPNATYWYALTSDIYEIPSPYTTSDRLGANRFGLTFEQSADVLYIACQNGDVPAYTLTRYGTTNWQFAQFSPTDGPFLEMNSNTGYTDNNGVAMYVSAINGSITIYAVGANVFTADDVGRLIYIQVQTYNVKPWASGESVNAGDLRRYIGNTYQALNTATTGTTAPQVYSGTQWDGAGNVQWQYLDSGYGTARITAYTSPTQVSANVILPFPTSLVGTTGTITGISQASAAVVTVANAFSVGDPVFITGVVGMTQINNKPYILTAVSGANVTLGSINSTNFTAYSSGGTIVKNASVYWRLGQWGATRTGSYPAYYPSCVAFYDERLFWAGGIRWVGSVPANYSSYTPDFYGQVTTDAAITGVLTAQDVNNISWMSAAQILLMGTAGGEFGLSAITTTNTLGPDNVHVVRQSKNGGLPIQPELVGTSLLYVNKSGRKILAMDYNFYIDRYDSTNQNRLAYHVTLGGITGIAWQSQPYETLWCARGDGVMPGYTFDREDQVTGWHRHLLGGNGIVKSVSVTPSADATYDEIWLIVQRTINGSTVNFVEYVAKAYESGPFNTDTTLIPSVYTDASYYYRSTPITTVTGLTWLEGQTVKITADGVIHRPLTVSGGSITLDRAASVITVGLPYTAILVVMRIEGGADVGTSQGKTKRITQGTLRLRNTIGGKVGMYGGKMEDIFQNSPSTPLDQGVPPFTGDITGIIWPGDYESDCWIAIVHDDPTPMEVVGIFPNLQTNEPT